jgi:hypothetical protein
VASVSAVAFAITDPALPLTIPLNPKVGYSVDTATHAAVNMRVVASLDEIEMGRVAAKLVATNVVDMEVRRRQESVVFRNRPGHAVSQNRSAGSE